MATVELRIDPLSESGPDGAVIARARLYADGQPLGVVVSFVWDDLDTIRMTVDEQADERLRAASVAEAVQRYRMSVSDLSAADLVDLPSVPFAVDGEAGKSWLLSGRQLPDLNLGSVISSWEQP